MSLELYLRDYERIRRDAPKTPEWLSRVRDDAMGRFQALGFPTSRDEEWRFTSVKPIAERAFALGAGNGNGAAVADGVGIRLAGDVLAELVFVDGAYAPALSSVGALPPGTRIESLRAALDGDSDDVRAHLTRHATFGRQAFTALNTAFLDDGALVRLPARTRLEAPIHLRFVSTAGDGGAETMSHPRVLVVLGEDSECAVVESYSGPEGRRYFTNAVTELVVGPNAVLDHYKLQQEGASGFHIAAMHILAARTANVASHSISFGGALVRNDVVAVLDGEGAECTLNGLYIADEARFVDNHTTIDHAKPHCASREVYKGILAGHARAVFNGKIVVRQDAQKTDAKQTNRALLLSEDAQINTKPQLEIFANDVKCTHGAAVGQLDEEALFYCRSRGLGELEARHLLIRAFASDVLTRMPLESLRQVTEAALLAELANAVRAA